jgi:hypothetical protein
VNGWPVLKAAAAGMGRRLVQTVVVFMVLATAATAAVVGLTPAATPTLAFQAVSARYHRGSPGLRAGDRGGPGLAIPPAR